MIRKDAIEVISKSIGDSPIISANGFISRDLFETNDKNSNFYMIGSMGLSSSIGLGISLINKNKKIYIFDGDGNILMNLGSLVTIGAIQPKNLVHIVFDNSIHESTGKQPTNSKKIKIENLAKATKYKVFVINSKKAVIDTIKTTKSLSGPIMIVVKIKPSNYVSTRVKLEPKTIKNRFSKSLLSWIRIIHHYYVKLIREEIFYCSLDSNLLNYLLEPSYFLIQSAGYIDPNSGIAIITMVMGAIAGVGMTLKLYWDRLKQKLFQK